MQRLGFESLIASRPNPERDAVCAMVAARILAPHTKLATPRWRHTTTLAEEYSVVETDETDLYAAMDWLLERQGRIQKKLAARHLSQGAPLQRLYRRSIFGAISKKVLNNALTSTHWNRNAMRGTRCGGILEHVMSASFG
jgi:hypothetical protein